LTSDLVKLGLQIAANNQGLIEHLQELEDQNEELNTKLEDLEDKLGAASDEIASLNKRLWENGIK